MKICCSDAEETNAVKWNPYNKVIQCHACGVVYTPIAEQLQQIEIPAIGQKSREDSIEVIKEMIDGGKLDGEEFIALNLALIALGGMNNASRS